MKEISLKVVPHKEQRYQTIGDYYEEEITDYYTGGIKKIQKITSSDLSNPDYNFLVMLHELLEWYITEKRGIHEPDIKAFDENFEAHRPEGDDSEPGDDKDAPYYHEHQFATVVERLVAHELGVDWNQYDSACIETLNERE